MIGQHAGRRDTTVVGHPAGVRVEADLAHPDVPHSGVYLGTNGRGILGGEPN
jgi:hypothetical protein